MNYADTLGGEHGMPSAGSTQNQALAALLFLYREVLNVSVELTTGKVSLPIR